MGKTGRRRAMARAPRSKQLCAYCGLRIADTEDHVIARQFFPAKQIYRGNLPKVPACAKCNSAKQRVEHGPGVIFQFGHSSDASRTLLLTQVSRRLQKNKRLHRSLRRALGEVIVKLPSGLLIPSLAITLSPRELADMWAWFHYVAQGLYYFELRTILPADHTIHLVKPTTFEQFVIFRDLITRDSKRQTREHASGEIRYAFTRNDEEQLTMWLLAFKSIEMFWLTAGPVSRASVGPLLANVEWTKPERD